MTLRARPVARRRGRAGWDPGDRRNSLINIGFFLAIGFSVLLLVGYAVFSWYNEHFGAVATVNGQTITNDQLRNRLRIETFRLGYFESRIATLLAKGRLTESEYQGQLQFVQQQRQQIAAIALERLVDVSLQGTLAAERSIQVSEDEISAEVLEESTNPEQRHVWVIEIEPEVDPDSGDVTPELRRAALSDAEAALDRLRDGESWEDVARTASDSGIAPLAGDLGWLQEESGYDEALMTAVFDAELNTPTDVIEGEDGVFRIGRATEVAPAEVDRAFETRLEDDGITTVDYRAVVRGDLVREKLSEAVVAEMSQPGPQRHVLEIYLPEPNESTLGTEDGVKVRHILFAPNDDSEKADDLPDDDPAWAEAEEEADAAYASLRSNPSLFDGMAREDSDEPSAVVTGGKQPWYYPSSSVDPAFKDAITAEGLEPWQVLEPVKTSFGWHVIQFMRPSGEGETAYLEGLKAEIVNETDFREAARDNSENEDAEPDGDIGWIAKGQLAEQLDAAVFSTGVGAMSNVVTVPNDGDHLLWILAEETRQPTEDQLAIFEDTGFQYWYTAQKEAADIQRNVGSQTAG
jgi:parvulin-like peptidyl-prolyl isomerase